MQHDTTHTSLSKRNSSGPVPTTKSIESAPAVHTRFQLLRAQKLIKLIDQDGYPKLKFLAQTLGVSGKTISRDFKSLADAGYPVIYDHFVAGYTWLDKPTSTDLKQVVDLIEDLEQYGHRRESRAVIRVSGAAAKQALRSKGKLRWRKILSAKKNQIEAEVAIKDEKGLAQFILSLGCEAEVLEPKSLKLRVAEEARKLLSHHALAI